MVRVESYKKHLQEQCRTHYTYQVIDSPSKITIGEVLSRPTDLPATPAEKKVAEHLVRKIINHQGDSDSREGVVRVPTRGQVSMYYQNLQMITIDTITK